MFARQRYSGILGLIALIAPSALAAPAPATDAEEACIRNLRAIAAALVTYQHDKGELPPHLSDLYPMYLTDRGVFHCPADPSPGGPAYVDAVPDPGLPVSYLYELKPGLPGTLAGSVLGPPEWSKRVGLTLHQILRIQRVNFGDRVPVAQCWHHVMQKKEVPRLRRDQPLLLNVTSTGQVYRSIVDWDNDPSTVPVVVRCLQRDLKAGPRQFRRRWLPDHLAGYFAYLWQNGIPLGPGLRARLGTLAGKLAALARGDAALADSRVYNAIGALYLTGGDPERALAALELAARMPPPHPQTAYLLTWLSRDRDRAGRAITAIKRLLSREPENRGFRSDLAIAYEMGGQSDKAAEWRRNADPGAALIGRPASDFTLIDTSGQKVRLADLCGKVVLLNFWTFG